MVKGSYQCFTGSLNGHEPLRIACGQDSLVITAGQRNDNGLYLERPQLEEQLKDELDTILKLRNYIMATISLYVSIYNLFISLLQIFGIMSSDD